MKKLKLFAFVLMLFGCNQHNSTSESKAENSTAPKQTIDETPIQPITKTGAVIESIPVYHSPADSFTLYLPKSYDSSKPTPLIVFLDPHAESVKVINMYKDLADKHGYIIACSNAAFNSYTLLQGITIANNLLADLKKRFRLDESKIIFSGFSGAAKIAIEAGCVNSDVDGIVYSGSVILWGNLNHPVSFLGIAGKEDMNYTELVSFHQSKYLADKPHYMVQWNGKHEWADAKTFENAFLFPFSNIPEKNLFVFDETQKQKFEMERQMRQGYYDALVSQNLSWWKTEAKNLHAKENTDIMYKRLLGTISLTCYSLSGKYLSQNDLDNVEKILFIYELVDPGNKDQARFYEDFKRRKGI